MARTAAAAAIVGLGFAGATAFVAPSSAGSARALRTQPVAQSQTSAGLTGACSVVVLAACGLAVNRRVTRRAQAQTGPSGQELAKTIPRPEDLPADSPRYPKFVPATGGYMSKTTKERHAITWTSPAAYQFELPTGTVGVMNVGENLCYFRRKEQCIALGKDLREMKIDDYKIYRMNGDGSVVFMHPADGVFPEKVNKGRVATNFRPFTVGQNPFPGDVQWTKYHRKPYEADPLSILFIKARNMAYLDIENLFAVPTASLAAGAKGIMGVDPDEFPDQAEYMKKLMAALNEAQKKQKEINAAASL